MRDDPLMSYRIWRDDVTDDGDLVSSKTEHIYKSSSEAIRKIHELEKLEKGVWFYFQVEFDD